MEPPITNCFGPQHLPEGEPSHAWTPQQLGYYAQQRDRQIVDGEKTLAPLYWQLGQSLSLARKHFAHGQWHQYLKELQIDRTRAAKALAIFRTFATEQLVEALTVEEAYGQRPLAKRAQPTKCKGARKQPAVPIPIVAMVNQIVELAASLQPDFKADRTEAREMLVLLNAAIARLNAVRNQLSQSSGLDADPASDCHFG